MTISSSLNIAGIRNENCAACGGEFECGADASSCWCSEISVTEAALADLAGRYSGCLCRECLIRLSGGTASDHPEPKYSE
ncbi:MAG TPA: cysteine-rich CWC family protein [Aridibacter sp.]|nr:cysteine-rich CWC family protein [Aridibacter sp.]